MVTFKIIGWPLRCPVSLSRAGEGERSLPRVAASSVRSSLSPRADDCLLAINLHPEHPTTCLNHRGCITAPTFPSRYKHHNVSRRRNYPLRHRLRPRHPRARPRLRVRTVRPITPRPCPTAVAVVAAFSLRASACPVLCRSCEHLPVARLQRAPSRTTRAPAGSFSSLLRSSTPLSKPAISNIHQGTVALSAVTSQPRARPPVACEYFLACASIRRLLSSSFAFVEYESRRDADDAYHEMHNKRIGRDDLLKIEVRTRFGM